MENMEDIIELSSGSDSFGTTIEEMERCDRFFSIVISGPPQPKPSPNFISWVRNGVLMRRVVNAAAPQMLEFNVESTKYFRLRKHRGERTWVGYPVR